MKFDTWFPTVIGRSHCPFIKEIQSKYKKHIKNYPSLDLGFVNKSVHFNPKFKKLNSWITEEVNKFSQAHHFPGEYEIKESWIWDYKVGGYLDFHRHPGYTLSALFFLEGHKEDAQTVFRNPIEDMKNPFKTTPYNSRDPNLYNSFTYKTCRYPPESGLLLVWRSYVDHAVEFKKIPAKRILFVYNLDPASS